MVASMRPARLHLLFCPLVILLARGCSGDDETSETPVEDTSQPRVDIPPPPSEDVAPPPVDEGSPLPDIVLPPPPPDDGVYGYAGGCYAIQGFDGSTPPRYVAAAGSGEAFAFSGESVGSAARFHMRASDLGTYLFYDTEARYLGAGRSTSTRRACSNAGL